MNLLFRVHHLQRYVHCRGERMRLRAASFAAVGQVSVYLPGTKQRKERRAQLQVSWGQVVCPPSSDRRGGQVALWLVKAIEVSPPAGAEPVAWYLLTTIKVED